MAGAQFQHSLPYRANGALVRHRFVKLDGDQEVVQCDSAGEEALGVNDVDISSDEASKGKAPTVQVEGVAWVEAGTGDLTRGQAVAVDADGKGVEATTGDVIVGKVTKGAVAGALALV